MVDPIVRRKSRLLNLHTTRVLIGSFTDHRQIIITTNSLILKNLSANSIIVTPTTVATNTNSKPTTTNDTIPTAALLANKVTILTPGTIKIVDTSSNISSILPTIPVMLLSTLVNGTTPPLRQLVMQLRLLQIVTEMFLTPLSTLGRQKVSGKSSIARRNMPILSLPTCTIIPYLTPRAITGLLVIGLRQQQPLPPSLRAPPTKKTLIFSMEGYWTPLTGPSRPIAVCQHRPLLPQLLLQRRNLHQLLRPRRARLDLRRHQSRKKFPVATSRTHIEGFHPALFERMPGIDCPPTYHIAM